MFNVHNSSGDIYQGWQKPLKPEKKKTFLGGFFEGFWAGFGIAVFHANPG